jgi:hypothetical protein
MQTESINANGKRTSLSPHCDTIILDPNAPKLSVEYAKARSAIAEDFKLNVKGNEPLAKRLRKQSKQEVVKFLNGKVSKNPEGNLIVTFPDNSVARL